MKSGGEVRLRPSAESEAFLESVTTFCRCVARHRPRPAWARSRRTALAHTSWLIPSWRTAHRLGPDVLAGGVLRGGEGVGVGGRVRGGAPVGGAAADDLQVAHAAGQEGGGGERD